MISSPHLFPPEMASQVLHRIGPIEEKVQETLPPSEPELRKPEYHSLPIEREEFVRLRNVYTTLEDQMHLVMIAGGHVPDNQWVGIHDVTTETTMNEYGARVAHDKVTEEQYATVLLDGPNIRAVRIYPNGAIKGKLLADTPHYIITYNNGKPKELKYCNGKEASETPNTVDMRFIDRLASRQLDTSKPLNRESLGIPKDSLNRGKYEGWYRRRSYTDSLMVFRAWRQMESDGTLTSDSIRALIDLHKARFRERLPGQGIIPDRLAISRSKHDLAGTFLQIGSVMYHAASLMMLVEGWNLLSSAPYDPDKAFTVGLVTGLAHGAKAAYDSVMSGRDFRREVDDVIAGEAESYHHNHDLHFGD